MNQSSQQARCDLKAIFNWVQNDHERGGELSRPIINGANDLDLEKLSYHATNIAHRCRQEIARRSIVRKEIERDCDRMEMEACARERSNNAEGSEQ